MTGERQNGIPPPKLELTDLSAPRESTPSPFDLWLDDFKLQTGLDFPEEQRLILSKYFGIRSEISLTGTSPETNLSINQLNLELDEAGYADDRYLTLALRSITNNFTSRRK